MEFRFIKEDYAILRTADEQIENDIECFLLSGTQTLNAELGIVLQVSNLRVSDIDIRKLLWTQQQVKCLPKSLQGIWKVKRHRGFSRPLELDRAACDLGPVVAQHPVDGVDRVLKPLLKGVEEKVPAHDLVGGIREIPIPS